MAWIPLELLFEVSPRQRARGKGKTKAQMVPATVSHCVLAT